jgi:hypothetical protein
MLAVNITKEETELNSMACSTRLLILLSSLSVFMHVATQP